MVTKKTSHTANAWRTSLRKSTLRKLKHSLENILEGLVAEGIGGIGSEVSIQRMEEAGSKVSSQRRLGARTGSRTLISILIFGVTIFSFR